VLFVTDRARVAGGLPDVVTIQELKVTMSGWICICLFVYVLYVHGPILAWDSGIADLIVHDTTTAASEMVSLVFPI
jgi:hypothetical protein